MKQSYIKRTRREKNFTHLGNEVFKSNLSPESLGVLCYILHLPDDWILRKKQLMSHFKIGRDKIDRIFKELGAAGYLAELIKLRGENGKFEGVNYIIYDKPMVKDGQPEVGSPQAVLPEAGLPYAVKPYSGKTAPTKNYLDKELIVPITNSLPSTKITKDSPEFEKLSDQEKMDIHPFWFLDK
jgi:hypothetical protein